MTITVEDHVAIQRLMYQYASCAERKNYPGFADVFCEDAVFDYSGREVRSLAHIQEMMLALETYTTTLHQVFNTLYEVDCDVAEGETYCLASHLRTDGGETCKIDMGILYQDRLRRTSEGWRIARRVFNLLWSRTGPVDVP